MTENPWQPSHATYPKPPTRPTRWLVRSGIVSLAAAFVCFLATLVGMYLAFQSIAHSTAPKASDFAQGIGVASIPSMASVPLAILGVVLIVAGLTIRQPIRDP